MARRDVDLGFELQTLDDILTDGQDVAQADDVTEDLHVLKKAEQKRKKHGHRRTTELIDVKPTLYWRKAYGVTNLLKVMGLERPEQGHAYHIISGGNVDLLCHLQWLLLHWPKMRRVFISAWAMSGSDILILEDMVKHGQIEALDILLGESYPTQYKHEWAKLQQMYADGIVRALYHSSIHSKFILIHSADDCKAVVESSANCNMNPRIEQTVATFSAELYDFYDRYYKNLFAQEDIIQAASEFKKLTTD